MNMNSSSIILYAGNSIGSAAIPPLFFEARRPHKKKRGRLPPTLACRLPDDSGLEAVMPACPHGIGHRLGIEHLLLLGVQLGIERLDGLVALQHSGAVRV